MKIGIILRQQIVCVGEGTSFIVKLSIPRVIECNMEFESEAKGENLYMKNLK